MMEIDFNEFLEVFNNWVIAHLPPEERRWYSVDGKTLKWSQRTVEEGYKEFVKIASVYSKSQGIKDNFGNQPFKEIP